MAYQIKDTTGEIESGAIYLPNAKDVPVGAPLVGVAISTVKEDLESIYGSRFIVVADEPKAPPAPTAPQTKTLSRKATEGKES